MTSPLSARSAGWVEVSREAIRSQLALMPPTTWDLRRDARGLGARLIAPLIHESGARVAAMDDADVEALRAQGLGRATVGEDLSALLAGAVSLHSVVLSVKPLRAGEGTSYGHHFRATQDTRIALVAGGYGQGIVRSLGNVAHVDIDGARMPIVGRVAMDVCVVDVGEHPVSAGDRVTFFGGGAVMQELDVWAASTGIAAADLATVVALRALERVWR